VISPNWIGDAIMAMPALQEYRRAEPAVALTVLARGGVADLWALHAAPDGVRRLDRKPAFFDPLYDELRAGLFDRAWILPNAFRSAWMAFRSGIPRRIALTGGLRRPLLTEVRGWMPPPERRHQGWEAMALWRPGAMPEALPAPELSVPAASGEEAARLLGEVDVRVPLIGLMPGAARGPSKRWPSGHFAETGRRLAARGARVVLLGGPDDAAVCRELAGAIGPAAVDLAGRTGLALWAALLARCSVVIANDSGGMHLAAALGRPVVALYGSTDPERTGPLGPACVVLQRPGPRGRAVARDDAEARVRLAAITPDEVLEQVIRWLDEPGASV
jgi:heptosyltransferase-2